MSFLCKTTQINLTEIFLVYYIHTRDWHLNTKRGANTDSSSNYNLNSQPQFLQTYSFKIVVSICLPTERPTVVPTTKPANAPISAPAVEPITGPTAGTILPSALPNSAPDVSLRHPVVAPAIPPETVPICSALSSSVEVFP
ncbi:hypothetical protein SAMN05660830_03114 [Halodesulfovibrio aestuarii]|uniref:Uncharacterized protein n=1 Tax=Halodesulfovibrio aestuarii TaxID=126333 RepID=A0A8G2FCA4_9BACT|nr:hypothetical protein SAMN05660830_03114 [Halodesulfovibrio aestuarii]